MSAAGPGTGARRLPTPRGPLTAHLVDRLRWRPHALPPAPAWPGDPLASDDLHLALYVCYELHYRGFSGVDEGWEWEPSLLALRRDLEAAFMDAELARVGPAPEVAPDAIEAALDDVLASGDAPSLADHIATRATIDELREVCVHRTAWQLKEADPHTWVVMRLDGGPKAALVSIQSDEYGNGSTLAMHSERYRTTLRALGLDDAYGAYLDHLPAVTLATVNLVSLLGLHRRWRGALVGHLCAFEMSSVGPMGKYAEGIRRLGVGEEAAAFFDVHVEADAVHGPMAARLIAAPLADEEPDLAGDIVLGARLLMDVEARFATHVTERFGRGETSLRMPLAGRSPATAATAG